MPLNCPVCGLPIESTNACPYCGYKLSEGTAQFSQLVSAVSDIPLTHAQKKFPAKAFLHVANGPNRGTAFPLSPKIMKVGRDPHCVIFLNDMTVSRQHAIISYTDGVYKISDCNSFNGLWVNNNPVDFKCLIPGDVIQIGAFTLLYKEESNEN